jgi:hypothetical protein
MMIGSSLSLLSVSAPASLRRPKPYRGDVAQQRRALFFGLLGSEMLAGLGIAAAVLGLQAGTLGQALAVALAIAAGLYRYVEIMFRLAYLNGLPLRDTGLVDLADNARRLAMVCATVFFAAMAMLVARG